MSMNLFSNEISPDCFGKGISNENCAKCPFTGSCSFTFKDDLRLKAEDRRWEGASEYIDNINPGNDDVFPVDISENRSYSRDEVIAISAFLLRIGRDRKLGKILTAKLMGARSFAEIARSEGVTRQAIHKRIGKQLAKIFGFKSRQLTDSRLLTLDPEEFSLLKLSRSGFEEEDILEYMKLTKPEFKKLRDSLDWKLNRPT